MRIIERIGDVQHIIEISTDEIKYLSLMRVPDKTIQDKMRAFVKYILEIDEKK